MGTTIPDTTDQDDGSDRVLVTPPEADAPRSSEGRRRRLGWFAAVGVAVAGVVVALVAVGLDDDPTDGADVVALGATASSDDETDADGRDEPDGPASTTTETAPTTTGGGVPPESLTLEPATGLDDGTEVTITLDEPVTTGEVIVAQCTSEVMSITRGDASEPLNWCTGISYVSAAELPAYTVEVRRVVHTARGPVDCAEPDRCILAVRVGGPSSTDDRFAVLRFRDDLAPVEEAAVTVSGADGEVPDGTPLQLRLTGVQADETVQVDQCRPGPTEDTTFCSSARALWTFVPDGPVAELTFVAFHDILIDATGGEDGYLPSWQPCAPCELVVSVGERLAPVARVPLTMAPTDAPVRPEVTIDAAGPLSGGTTVAVRATGLQPGTEVRVGWCPTSRFQGGGDPPCVGSAGHDTHRVTVAADGTLSVPTFALPVNADDVLHDDCTQPGRCGVGIEAEDAYSVLAITPVTVAP